MSEPSSLYFEPSVEEKEEEVPSCPMCSAELYENEDGQLACPNFVYHQMDKKRKVFLEGQWFSRRNVEVEMLWQNKQIAENKPVCDACGKKVSGKEVELAVAHHHISYTAYTVNRLGEYNEKLGELYKQVRKRKISATEAFRIRTQLRQEYFERPKAERPMGQTNAHVPLKCPACKKALGLIEVTVKANPSECPEPSPSYREYALLPKTPEETRLIQEKFHIADGMTLKQWFEGKDVKAFISKLEKTKNDISKLPYMRNVIREVSDLNALIYRTVEKLQEEVRLRPDAIYALLKSPPKTM